MHHHHRRNGGSSRYFTGEIQLPSLYVDNDIITNTNDEKNDLHVLYTNDPGQVSLWLADHVPSTGCTLGFDVEVGCFLAVYEVDFLRRLFVSVVFCVVEQKNDCVRMIEFICGQ
jgi:hypothetical protein